MLTIRAGGTWTGTGTGMTGGTWLHSLGYIGDITFKTAWPGGLLTVSWRMRLPEGFTHPTLRQGSIVELHDGALIGYAIMAEPDREGWTFTADGMALALRGVLALDVASFPTTDLASALLQAAARGWPIVAGTGVPATPLSSMSSDRAEVNNVVALADAYGETVGQRWAVDPAGALYFAADPAPGDVDWVITPGTPSLATADDDYASLVVLRYVSAATGAEPTAWDVATATDPAAAARWGAREVFEDGEAMGVLTSGTADTNAAAILASKRARPAYTQSLEVARHQITTPGGTPAHLTYVRAGQRVRQYGVVTADGSGTHGTAEWVIGGTDHTAGSRVITLTPVDRAPRTLAQTIQGLALRDPAERVRFK